MTTDHDGRGTTRLTADDRRLAILDNAELVFVKNGFQSTSTREIAEACGVTEPVLYRHFKGKEDLFLSVVARMFEDCLKGSSVATGQDSRPNRPELRILEALLLCKPTRVEEAGSLARSRGAALKAAFTADRGDRADPIWLQHWEADTGST